MHDGDSQHRQRSLRRVYRHYFFEVFLNMNLSSKKGPDKVNIAPLNMKVRLILPVMSAITPEKVK